jgi:acyl-CoA synthetase (AMP-forming)/AMP-acid ligase II
MLHDTVEEHREKPAVDQSGRALVDHRETNSPRGCFAVEVIKAVFRKAWVERADVCRVIEVYPPGAIVVVPDPRCAVRWNRRGHRYLDDLRSTLGVTDLTETLQRPDLPALRQVWAADRLPDVSGAESNRSIVDALAATVTPSDPMVIMFTSGSSGAPKGVVHSHGSALGAVRSGLASRCLDSETRLYLPMPFFWVGGFGSGVLSALVAGATLITEAIPQPTPRCACLNANG